MLPQFDRDVFDISPDKIAKVDHLHTPDLTMLHFPQNLKQNKKYCYHVTYHVTPKSFEQFLHYLKFEQLGSTANISGWSDTHFLAAVGWVAPATRVTHILVSCFLLHFGHHGLGNAVNALLVVLVDHTVSHALHPVGLAIAVTGSTSGNYETTGNVILSVASSNIL